MEKQSNKKGNCFLDAIYFELEKPKNELFSNWKCCNLNKIVLFIYSACTELVCLKILSWPKTKTTNKTHLT